MIVDDTHAGPISDTELLRILIHGTTAFELLRTALEFELFERIEEAGGLDLAGVARTLGVEEQPARILLLGVASLRLVHRNGDLYVNTAVTRSRLLRDSQRFLGPLVDIQAEIINTGIADFAASMRSNTNVGLRHFSGQGDTLYERLASHPELQETFYRNMGDASRKSFPVAAEAFDFGRLTHVADIGGGDGSNAIELAKRYRHLRVTVFDQESVVELARENARRAGVADRVAAQAGDFFTGPLPGDIDGILYFHIFEIWSMKHNVELLRRCHAVLPPGGAVLVFNFVSEDDNTGPLTAGLMSPYFLALASGEGMAYAPRDMEAAVRAAGFSTVERYDDLGFHHALVAGIRD